MPEIYIVFGAVCCFRLCFVNYMKYQMNINDFNNIKMIVL